MPKKAEKGSRINDRGRGEGNHPSSPRPNLKTPSPNLLFKSYITSDIDYLYINIYRVFVYSACVNSVNSVI
jgi:hypothetical protein